jgi:formylglycine-generating enzyme required for sulfatase activity
MAGKIFINYRRVESSLKAQLLKAELVKAFGEKRVFLDVHGIGGGENWLQMLERQVAASAAMIVLIGKDWVNLKDEHGNRRLDDPHDKVRFEISQALLRNLPIIPVSLDLAPVPKATQLPDNLVQLTLMQAMPLREQSFATDAEAIAKRLRALLAKREQHRFPTWAWGLGLLAAFFAGSVTPIVSTRLGHPFPSVAADAQLRADLVAAQKERDDARKEAALARTATFSFRECSECPEMTVVPAGSFTMGSPPSEAGRGSDENSQHRVTFARPFAVGQFALTFEEWDACIADGGCNGYQPSDGWGRGRRPVINVSWDDAKGYVAWLSKKTGKTYRLLTEAEYEYATRAGTQTAYPWGNAIGKNNANCNGCGSQWDNKQTAPVGSFAANGFGLYDMVGNVLQWTEDCYNDNYNGAPANGSAWTGSDCGRRVVRGGSWYNYPEILRSANRNGIPPSVRPDDLGFRVGRTLLPP